MKSIANLIPSALLSVGLFAGSASAQNTAAPAPTSPKAVAKAAAPGKPDEAAMMAAMAKQAEVTDNHKKLKALVGKWQTTSRMWSAPDQPPVETKGTAEKRLILGDRFVQEEYKGTVMGKPFSGQGLTGYDNNKQKFTNTWTDTMSTSLFTTEGTADASGKDLVLTGTSFCPIEKRNKSYRQVLHIDSDKKHTLEMFEVGADGKENKTMEVVYTRK
jgi:hypothetical protein